MYFYVNFLLENLIFLFLIAFFSLCVAGKIQENLTNIICLDFPFAKNYHKLIQTSVEWNNFL